MWLMAHEKGHQLAVSESDDAAALQFSKALCEAQPGRLDYSEWYTQALTKDGRLVRVATLHGRTTRIRPLRMQRRHVV